MRPAQKTARLAGALYLLSAFAAGIPLMLVPGKLIVDGNAAATAARILASEELFRGCIVSELAGAVLLLFLARSLDRLLGRADETQASLMIMLVMVSIPITFIGVLEEVAALALFRGEDLAPAFDKPHRDALAMLFLDLHGDGVGLANIFWGLWLLPLGVLVWKSGLLPKILGVLLMINCCALVFVSLTSLLLPAYLDLASRFAVIPELGELWMMLWLLVKGVREPEPGAAG